MRDISVEGGVGFLKVNVGLWSLSLKLTDKELREMSGLDFESEVLLTAKRTFGLNEDEYLDLVRKTITRAKPVEDSCTCLCPMKRSPD